jgi:glutamate/aspartate transport system substrate-binding protein
MASMAAQAQAARARLRGWLTAGIAIALLGAGAGVLAQPIEEPAAGALTGVLKRIKVAGVVRIGYRQGAVPFAFEGRDVLPYGYSIDLCHEIVENLAQAVGLAALRIEYRRVTPADRIAQVVDGQIDLECGATTNTAERRKQVAFSPLIYVTGTRLLVRRGSPVRSLRDLAGRKVVVARGTTNEDAMRQLAAKAARGAIVLTADDHAQALEKLASGEADALAADDILLAGYLAEKGLHERYVMVGDLLSYEPYGIMFARDDAALAAVVEATFRRLAESRELRWIYNKWFLRRLPSGIRLGLPMSAQLQRSFELLGLPPE